MKISSGQLLCFITIFIRQLYGQEIIDFTYSAQHHQKTQNYVAESIQILPNTRQIIKFEFPEVCSITKTIQKELQGKWSYQQQKGLEIDYERIKRQAIQLLKLSEKIKNIKKSIRSKYKIKLENTQLSFQRKIIQIDISENELSNFRKQQQSLIQLQEQIKRETKSIQLQIQSSMAQYHNPFQLSALKYSKRALEIKIKYLQETFGKLKTNDISSFKVDYQSYKQSIRGLAIQEGEIIDMAKRGISYNQTKEHQLLQKISLLKESINYKNLILQNKKKEQVTRRERNDKFRSRQKQTVQIQVLIKRLKDSSKNSQRLLECQQIKKKIIKQINQSINYYNYSYSCTSGTEVISNQIQKLEYQLTEAQKQLSQTKIDKEKIQREFKGYYQRYIGQIASMKLNFQSLKIEQYSHSKTQIQAILNKAKQQLMDIEVKIERSKPYQKKAYNKDYLKLKIQKIKKMKATYCRDNELYREKSKEFQGRIAVYELKVKYNQEIYYTHENEVKQLNQLQRQFREKKSIIIQRLS